MTSTQLLRFRFALGASAAALAFLGILVSLGRSASGAAFSQNDYAVGGDPKTAPYPNAASNFFRWEAGLVTYAFDPSFMQYYGTAGETEVNKAFSTWDASIAATTGPNEDHAAVGGTDVSIRSGGTGFFDLQSVALHEIGHSIGFDHPDAGDNPGNNFNVDGTSHDWVNGALPAGSHPVMWSTLDPNISRQDLTLDDIQAVQFLYSQNTAGAGQGDAGGPVFGNSAAGLIFSNLTGQAGTPNILIKAGVLGSGTLASTNFVGAFQAVGGFTYTIPDASQTDFTITFPVPEPSAMVLWIMAVSGLVAVLGARKVGRVRRCQL